MMNFYQFFDKLNGKPYEDGVPAPVSYDFLDYVKGITPSNTPMNNVEGKSSYDLIPLDLDDMAPSVRQSPEEYAQLHKGKKMGLGEPMTDDDLKKFYGQTW